jgi:hypothetical protein
MTTPEIIPILQLAVSPVILISSVGLLLLTMNNRMAHSIDRARLLARESSTVSAEAREKIDFQIAVIYRRAKLIRQSIVFITLSALSSAILVISLFVTALLGFDIAWLYSICFIVALLCLTVGLTLIIWEVNDSLVALQKELEK